MFFSIIFVLPFTFSSAIILESWGSIFIFFHVIIQWTQLYWKDCPCPTVVIAVILGGPVCVVCPLALVSFLLFLLKNKFIYLFLAALGLCCWARAFSSCGEQGLLFVVVLGPLIAVVSFVVVHGLQARGLQ